MERLMVDPAEVGPQMAARLNDGASYDDLAAAFDVPREQVGEVLQAYSRLRREEMVRMAEEGMLQRDIAEHFGVTRQRVQQILKEAGRTVEGPVAGPDHPNWGGKLLERKDGALLAMIPEGHPRHGQGEKRGPQHELIIEEELGRTLREDEYVWHKDRDKSNNARENLELISLEEAQQRWSRPAARKYTREGLVRLLRWLALKVGHTPAMRDINTLSPTYHHVYTRYFPSLPTAQEAAGLEPNERGHAAKPLPEGWREEWEWLLDEYETAAAALHGDGDGT